jgi:hypothetical protein
VKMAVGRRIREDQGQCVAQLRELGYCDSNSLKSVLELTNTLSLHQFDLLDQQLYEQSRNGENKNL